MISDDVIRVFCALIVYYPTCHRWNLTVIMIMIKLAASNLFTQKARAIDGLPSIQADLIQMMVAAPELFSLGDLGWKRKEMNTLEVDKIQYAGLMY